MSLTSLARRALRYGAYPAFGLAVFVGSLYATFPYDRLRDRLVQSLQGGPDLDVAIGAIEPTWTGGIVLRDVTVRPKSDDGAEPGATLKISQARVGFGLWAALTGSIDVDFTAQLLGGELDGEVENDEEATRVRLDTDGLAMDGFPWIPSTIGLPLLGKLEAHVDLALPKGQFSQAAGVVSLFCRGCALGDGKSKFRMAGTTGFMADGVTLPKLRIGDWKGRMVVDNGNAKLEGFESKSPDGETGLEGDVALRDPIAQSQMKAYFRFKLASELKLNDPKIDLMDRGLSQSGRRTDGFYGFRISGRLGAMRFLPSRYSPTASTTERAAGRPKRPSKWTPPTPSGDESDDDAPEASEVVRRERSVTPPPPPPSTPPPAPAKPAELTPAAELAPPPPTDPATPPATPAPAPPLMPPTEGPPPAPPE